MYMHRVILYTNPMIKAFYTTIQIFMHEYIHTYIHHTDIYTYIHADNYTDEQSADRHSINTYTHAYIQT